MERDSAAKKKGYTAKSYQKALSEGLLLVYDGTRRFQQDNARIHNFGGTPQFLQLHGVEYIDWPPHSPDLNPIEHVWRLLKDKLAELCPHLAELKKNQASIEELEAHLRSAWEAIPQDRIDSLLSSLPRRLAAVRKARALIARPPIFSTRAMATRILVKCSSDTIPGEAIDRRTTIANIVCKHHFGRNFDGNTDGLHSAGQYNFDDRQCYFLIDVGPRGSQNPGIINYVWNGETLSNQRATPPLIRHLTKTYPFNPAPTEVKLLSDEEYRTLYGENAFETLVINRIKAKWKMSKELSAEERHFLDERPELADTLRRE
ncbi:hypothetical protein HIM_10740 [Hirsutella minnesotensis 3608]|uniref:Tc1-like transposase DDE domain-containing protein n=1 Tax=Hirsutella minnesotensis 3608 TaxID=1043627 RepID=A0A0F7ZFW8_9HYPO|nr:hypothetical protein HIM_10740 [Hirsutella minnesotensis 3608]